MASLTKKHFKILAEVVSRIQDDEDRRRTAEALVVLCYQVNSNFSKTTFLDACEVTE